MDRINIRVLFKEPRGFIRLLQIVFGLFAWSTTANFATKSILYMNCPDENPFTAEYKITYPFDLRETIISAPYNCTDDSIVATEKLPVDFSSTAMLYVLVCIVSVLYALSSVAYYSICTAKYETDPLAPMFDLCLTLFLTILWIVITLTWALNVSDLKHYTHPHYFMDYLTFCHDENANCQPSTPGKWSSLTVSIVCGFTCVVLWLGSTWFIFKETTLHKKQTYQTSAPQQQS